jgi:hypothetical protein
MINTHLNLYLETSMCLSIIQHLNDKHSPKFILNQDRNIYVLISSFNYMITKSALFLLNKIKI